MDRIVILEGQELKHFLDYMERITQAGTPAVYSLRVTVDGDQVKLKVNQATWTPGYGELAPESREAAGRPSWLPDPTRCANPWHQTAPARMIQSCPECPTHPDVPAQAIGYRAAH
jgi:hypothetical protein